MKLDIPKKRLAFSVAAVVLAAGVVAGRERPAIELVQAHAPRAAAALDDDIDLDKLRRGELKAPQGDPFATKSPEPRPAAPAAQAAAPAPPAPPPLPFQYIGKWSQGDKSEVLVLRGEELLGIAAGQKIDDYRVEQIGDASISFTYLPLKARQTLELPAVN